MKRLLFALAVLTASVGNLMAQSGELSGRVTDEKGEGVPFASVVAEQEGSQVSGVTTDFEGYFTIKPLNAGKYDLKVSYIGYATSLTKGIVVSSDKIREVDVIINPQATMIEQVEVVEYRTPLIDKENNSTKNTITQDEIKALPTRDINSIASTTAGVYQADEGGGLNIKGARDNATRVYIDGIPVRGSSKIPAQAIQELTVITGGIPAKYGDATGGVVTITTAGPSRTFGGGIELATSQGMDTYGYNLGTFNLSGPMVKKNKGTENEKVLLGFFVSGEYLRYQDADPSIVGVYKAKDGVLEDLRENPLVVTEASDAFVIATETVTRGQLEKIKTKENVAENNYSLSGKFDFRLSDNINLAAGGNIDYSRRHDWVSRYTLFNSENNPFYKENTWRVYARFTQKFRQKNEAGDEEKSKSAFQNAYYTVQVDYTKVLNTYEDESHGFKPFHYGYLGKYNIYDAPIYGYGTDDSSGKSGYLLLGYQDTLVTFEPSDVNPTTTNFTEKYFELAGDNRDQYYRSLDLIQLNNGMLNGQRPRIPHGIWYGTGRQFNGYAVDADNEQYRLSVSGSVDILRPGAAKRNKHSLEFGFEFEQRIDRRYSIAPIDLWTLMRLSANRHISDIDTKNPIFIIDGVEYAWNDPNAPAFSPDDTIRYNRLVSVSDTGTTSQTFFDKSIRKKLGLAVDGDSVINIDAFSPDFYSLDMFSADELNDFMNASNGLGYYGYDYLGNRLKSQPSFDDFFKEKDENGNYTRPIGAFRPIYTAAYIQDKFTFKDLLFNIGFRVDRFDANQKVLRDPFTLYQSYTVGESRDRLNGDVPGNMGSDYVVYVDDFNKANPVPVGYRDGSTWYNAEGVEINNPQIIATSSSNGQITPYLVNSVKIDEEAYEPSTSFKDYDPQVTFMPRVAFSFQLTDNADFFAHYDVLTQRPPNRLISSPLDWYYFEENVGGVINNPSLKPERTIDYQIGFRQKVAKNAAVTISGFYRELKDMIQVVNKGFAYPRSYLTFDNADFGTVKGFSLSFDLRKTKTSNISLKANYTLQFAEGTGSNETSQFSLVNATQPNLKAIVPLDYDSRHLINFSVDYSYGEGKDYNGPKIKGKDILSNTGINIIARMRSGEPYTAQANATGEALFTESQRTILDGSINGSRLPWNYRIDFRIFKDFNLRFKKTDEGKARRDIQLGVYLLIQNLLNTKNIIKVYPYSGSADDDGYLASPEGQQKLETIANAQSFEDLYRAWNENGYNNQSENLYPSNFSRPRVIRVGLSLDF